MATTPAACASCVLGPAATSLLSFSAHAVETITVSVIPHLTVFTNGSRTVNYERITETATDFVGSAAGSNGTAKTFSNQEDITWTVGDATLTYGTTYIQYLGFSGALEPTPTGDACAQPADISSIALPSSTDCASYIYPYSAGMALPTPLLDYLGQIPVVSSQFNGEDLAGCSPLSYVPAITTSSSEYALLIVIIVVCCDIFVGKCTCPIIASCLRSVFKLESSQQLHIQSPFWRPRPTNKAHTWSPCTFGAVAF